jgi:ATP-binding cassette subfamily B (MDR/TAP) protein 1
LYYLAELTVPQGLNIKAKPGQTIALVGPSGSGKSTIIGLYERFYDLNDGFANLEYEDVRSWNIQCLRSHIALVGQEPTLFSGTVRENILLGLPQETLKQESSHTLDVVMVEAAKMANVHEFVMSLPNHYDTYLGSKVCES